MKKYMFLFLLPSFIFQIGCSKDEEDPKEVIVSIPMMTVNMSHVVSGDSLVFNERIYHTPANNPIEVRHLEYFISDFKLMDMQSQWITISSQPKLINPQEGVTQTFLMNVPVGEYKGLSCMIGIPVVDNYTGSLLNTIENVNMAWPEPIGGGYHFMKLEGNYEDLNLDWRGYTVHLGDNGNQAPNLITDVSITVSSTNTSLELIMDINQWFDNPNLYDFNVDGNYTMAIDSLMEIVSENGRNCLSVK